MNTDLKNTAVSTNIYTSSLALAKSLALILVMALSFPTSSVADDALPISKAQKGVRTSTDVVLVALPAAAIIGTIAVQDWEGLKQGAFTAAATVGATYILKYAVRERRPDHSDYHSFPSGHSSSTFAAAAYLQRRYGWKFGGPAYALAAYTAWGRVYSDRHHWWDVLTGAAIGAGSAYIFTRPWARDHQLSITPFTTGQTHGLTASFQF